ncbi:hypothetical protein FA13DRAFT_1732203 [Coprinellus micaceus]|jgi:hypothetical protein|uniref:Uncharacterized protein n=1 Tax=Coprinellus micaceus TaxID=71717 RepID=A0A4Y7TEB1_COPMI|nr:hypothetical protein FA13DRAFT_1732203 [Coprinellus micaceus]
MNEVERDNDHTLGWNGVLCRLCMRRRGLEGHEKRAEDDLASGEGGNALTTFDAD